MSQDADFFIGWSQTAQPRLARFWWMTIPVLMAGVLLLALMLGRAVDADAGDYVGEATLAWTLETLPYPLLRAPPDAVHPQGHTVLLAGDGKYGIGAAAETSFAGRAVAAHGALVKRGDLDMLVISPAYGLSAAQGPAPATPLSPVQLGRWRASGEICDGKCTAGVMRPGAGIAHKACASLCVSGGVPPVFVTTQQLEGAGFLLLADHDGGPAPAVMSGLIAQPVTLEGEVERRGDLLVFRVDWTRARAR